MCNFSHVSDDTRLWRPSASPSDSAHWERRARSSRPDWQLAARPPRYLKTNDACCRKSVRLGPLYHDWSFAHPTRLLSIRNIPVCLRRRAQIQRRRVAFRLSRVQVNCIPGICESRSSVLATKKNLPSDFSKYFFAISGAELLVAQSL